MNPKTLKISAQLAVVMAVLALLTTALVASCNKPVQTVFTEPHSLITG